MFGIPYKIVASVLVGSAIILAVIFVVGIPLNFIM
jgi:hypothetical protein